MRTKWIAVVAGLVAAVGLLGMAGCDKRSKTVDMGIVCKECGFEGVAKVTEGQPLPVKCPKCGKMTAYLGFLCPNAACGKQIPWDGKTPPAVCPHCKQAIGGKASEVH